MAEQTQQTSNNDQNEVSLKQLSDQIDDIKKNTSVIEKNVVKLSVESSQLGISIANKLDPIAIRQQLNATRRKYFECLQQLQSHK